MLKISTPPKHICILRLSAIGDICHTLPVVRTIQTVWPQTQITWVIGKTEFELVKGIDNINFITFDKKAGLWEYLNIRTKLQALDFDILLHMQMSFRASLISLFINAKYKIGFDRKRAKDLQWLFTNQKIKFIPQQHVIDSLFGFTETLGITEHIVRWDIPITESQCNTAKTLLGKASNYIIISPCSSKAYRNWSIEGYASIADYIKEKYNYDVVLTGGNSEIERTYGDAIVKQTTHTPINLIGKTNLKELLAIIDGAQCVICPDSGPAHMATAMHTPVIGLYATTNPDRARPYLSEHLTVNKYPEAIFKKYHQNVNDIPWGIRVRDTWAMNLITSEDIQHKIDNFIQASLKS